MRRLQKSSHGAITRSLGLPARLPHHSIAPPVTLPGIGGMTSHSNVNLLNPAELGAWAARSIYRIKTIDKQFNHQKSGNGKLANKIALL